MPTTKTAGMNGPVGRLFRCAIYARKSSEHNLDLAFTQEQAFGGLDRESLSFLDGLARRRVSPRRHLKPGTVLVREYQGERHTHIYRCGRMS